MAGYAQKPAGARAAGVAGASVTLGDGWAVFNNVAGTSYVEEVTGIFGFESRYQFFNTLSAGLVVPHKLGSFSTNIYRFGDQIFSESRVGLGFSHQIGITSLGIQVNYLQFRMEGLEGLGILTFDAGGIIEIVPSLFFGAHISNVSGASFSKITPENVPVVLKAGISYRMLKKLMLNLEAGHEPRNFTTWKAGLEYEIIKFITARSGFNAHSQNFFFGLGFKMRKIDIDYALGSQQNLGFSHFASIQYRFKNP